MKALPAVASTFFLFLVFGCSADESMMPLVGTLERERIDLIAEAAERIVELSVVEGDTVAAGQQIMRLDDARQQIALRQARARREQAAARLAELLRGPREEAIRAAREQLRGAQDHLSVQTREFARVESLVEQNLLSQTDLDRALNAVDTARAQVRVLSATLDELLAGTTVEEVAQAQAQLDEADAAVDAQSLVLERLTIRAPRAGIIEAVIREPGAQPKVGDAVVSMLVEDRPYVRVYLPQALRTNVDVGTAATVRVDGHPESYAGTIRFISATAAFTPYFSLTERDRGRLSYLTEIGFDDAVSLPAGVPVEVTLEGPSM